MFKLTKKCKFVFDIFVKRFIVSQRKNYATSKGGTFFKKLARFSHPFGLTWRCSKFFSQKIFFQNRDMISVLLVNYPLVRGCFSFKRFQTLALPDFLEIPKPCQETLSEFSLKKRWWALSHAKRSLKRPWSPDESSDADSWLDAFDGKKLCFAFFFQFFELMKKTTLSKK